MVLIKLGPNEMELNEMEDSLRYLKLSSAIYRAQLALSVLTREISRLSRLELEEELILLARKLEQVLEG